MYATSDAAWLTEVDDEVDELDELDDTDQDDQDDGDDTADDTAGVSTHRDTGDSDADDRPDQDGMTDDSTTRTDDRTRVDDTSTGDDARATEGTGVLPAAAASTTTKPSTAKKPRAKRPSRATRSQGAAAAETAGTDKKSSATSDRTQGDVVTDAEPPVRADGTGTAEPRTAEPRTAEPRADATTQTKPAPKKKARTTAPKQAAKQQPVVLRASGLVKRYGQTLAADEVDLEIRQGSIFGVVGPNGAGKTTTLSMLTGLLRPDAGTATVLDHDVWADPAAAKRSMGVLPDRLRLFDRLTGAQLLFYSATLRGIDGKTARARSSDLAEAFGLGDALGRPVADYSVGMAKKIALAATLIHSPRVLVLDEPFESVDPVSAATITEILRRYTQGGGTVVLSSHSMELVQRTCDSVAIIVGGKVLASGTMAQVRGRKSLEDKFVELAGGRVVAESMEWLHSFSG
ncbi:ABC-2 type transport system ATP-binding protein [Curtobacterium sp. ZW137]|nr:ABC-2 type transport system ATP-binding protein [Curtobacterium sp. ZW137]